jgi:glycosyltransferase involved in cell wall biosynthesis
MSPLPEGISVVIPCLNERETLSRAVKEGLEGIRRSGLPGEVLVSDNGSTDGSPELALAAGARVVNATARGYGAALDFGIRAAGYRYVVIGDADLSYPFEEVGALLAPLREGTADFVLGNRLNSRMQSRAMPWLNRILGTPVLSLLIRWFHRIPVTDCNSGMRAFRSEEYPALRLLSPGMEFASEMLVRAAALNLRYVEVPIGFRRDARSRAPHLRRWRDGWRHLRFIVACAPTRLVLKVPFAVSVLLFAIAFALSLAPYFNPGVHVRYHTAFSLIAIACPLLFFIISIALIKAAFFRAGRIESASIRRLSEWSETVKPFVITCALLALLAAEAVLLLLRWRGEGYGELSDPSAVIRIMIYSIWSAACVSLDIGLGLIRLLPIAPAEAAQAASLPLSSPMRAICAPGSK